jgi:quinolinate synthase
MKTITLDNILASLETLSPEVRVPAETARKARRAVDRMLELV